jgi:glycosyltransferase involved in cell wall biosynthesis
MLKDIRILLIQDFSICDDPVKTEEEIFNQIKDRTILTDYVYVVFPIAFLLNKYGVPFAQQVIDKACSELGNNKAFFVCQHIKVSELDFHGHLVFTPHATEMNGYEAIPHYSANVIDKPSVKSFFERDYEMSFLGSFLTHWTRKELAKFSKNEKCFVQNSGLWNFQKGEKERKRFETYYVNLLNDTKIALCPRGTGPSTIRLWEAMGSGCVPLVISDYLKMPMEKTIDWDDLIINVPENDVENLLDYLPNDATLKQMSEECLKVYYENFSNDNLYKTIMAGI